MKNINFKIGVFYLSILLILVFNSADSYARRTRGLYFQDIMSNLSDTDIKRLEGDGLFMEHFAQDPEIREKLRRLGEILEDSDNAKSKYISSIARDLVVLAESLKYSEDKSDNELKERFNSLLDMVLRVSGSKRDVMYTYYLMRSLDVAISDRGWMHFREPQDNFSFSMDKIAQLVRASDLKATDVLGQLNFFLNKAGGDQKECNELIADFIFDSKLRILRETGFYSELRGLGPNKSLAAISFDWGGTLSLIMSDVEIRDNVREMLVDLKNRGTELYIVTNADPGEIEKHFLELDREERKGFSWFDTFRGRIRKSFPAQISPNHTKGAYLQAIAEENPNGVVVHFDDSEEYSNLGILAANLVSVAVITRNFGDSDFEQRVESLSQAWGLAVDLGFDYPELFKALCL
jgi:hypothetical protein